MLELEKTYLAKTIPQNLTEYPHKEIIDVYIPGNVEHPVLRLRKQGDCFEITKKEPLTEGDASVQREQTIKLTAEEFAALYTKVEGKKVRKLRYYYPHGGQTAEIDVFQDELFGLVLIDFEFTDITDKDAFVIPDFCLVDVTQETFIAGGKLCGKSYADIRISLEKFGYEKVFVY